MECSTPGVRAPWDCANPEQDATNLAISKVVVTVDKSMIGAYVAAATPRSRCRRGALALKAKATGPRAGLNLLRAGGCEEMRARAGQLARQRDGCTRSLTRGR